MDQESVRFVTEVTRRSIPIGVICHGGWILIEAWAVNGRTLTSYPSLRTDLQNAGARWVDEEVHNDHGLVSSRRPDDLPAFNAKIVEEFAEGAHARKAA
jgi:protease I